MKAEFRSEELQDLPDLVVTTDNEIEWRALQLFMRLMDTRKVKLTFEFDAPDVAASEDPEEVLS